MAVDFFLKLEGVDGESTDDRHKNELDIESFSWGETQTGSAGPGGGGGAGKVVMQDFHFVAKVSKASPILFLKCATGEHLKQAILTVRKSGGRQQDFYVITLTDVMITQYSQAGPGGLPDSDVNDAFALNFARIDVSYSPQKPDGSPGEAVKAGYDVKANKKA